MLDTGLPLHHEKKESHSVSPLSSRHASRSSTPGISSLDGTPRYLFALSSPPPRPRSTPPTLDMAVKPSRRKEPSRKEHSTKVTANQSLRNEDPSICLAANGIPSPRIHEECHARTVPSLHDLSSLLRLESHERQRSFQVQRQLHFANITAARTARLLLNTRSVQRTLAECIRSEDKHSFVNLFNSLQDAISDCCDPTNGQTEEPWKGTAGSVAYPTSCLDNLPVESQARLLDLLSKIRNDGGFVADRLANLTHRELVALLPEKGLSKSGDSIFSSSSRISSRTSKHFGFVVDGQTELLSSHAFASPLDALIHSIRDLTGQSLQDDSLATDVWSTVCARLIAEQKPGSEKLVPAVIGSWATSSVWPGKERLESWLQQTLQDGAFLLEQPNKQSFRLRVQGRLEPPAEDEVRLETFHAEALDSLLCLLTDTDGASLIPEGALRLSQAICRKLQHSPGHQRAFPNFVVTRWLLPYLTDAITTPEIHGLLTAHFIPDNARQRILREVANRCQKVVLDVVYSWKLGNPVASDTTQLVRNMANRFQAVDIGVDKAIPNLFQISSLVPENRSIIAVSSNDVLTLVNALYPEQTPPSYPNGLSSDGLASSASSISGFSLFQNVVASEPARGTSPASAQEPHSPIKPDDHRVLHDDREAHGEHESPFDLTALGDELREACAGLEDLIASDQLSSSNQWSVLIENPGTQRLYTVREELRNISISSLYATGASLSAHVESKSWRVCKEAVQELLLDPHGLRTLYSPSTKSDLQDWLVNSLQERIQSFQEKSNFVAAHACYYQLRHTYDLFDAEHGSGTILALLDEMSVQKQQYLNQASSVTDSCDNLLRSLRPVFEDLSKDLAIHVETADCLRDKMWYTADVRTSAIYDEARSIAAALKVMGRPRAAARTRMSPPLRRWSGAKSSSTNLHLKTEAQILEILCAPPGHGGPNKLSDDQSKAVSTWMENNSIENFCRGEERLHKLCLEVHKAVADITAEGSALRSSVLFARENAQKAPMTTGSADNTFWALQRSAGRYNMLTLRTDVPRSIDAMSTASSHALSGSSSRDYIESWSPSVTNKSSLPFWSPAMTESLSPSSATSIGSSQTQGALVAPIIKRTSAGKTSLAKSSDRLRQHAIALFLSDLSSTSFGDGSETDRAFWTGIGGELSRKHIRSLTSTPCSESPADASPIRFDFENAFRNLSRSFAVSYSPYLKLDRLLEIDSLLAPYMTDRDGNEQFSRSKRPARAASQNRIAQSSTLTDIKVSGFRRLFCSGLIPCETIFRDLQFIAALVPSNILDTTPEGKAFWNASVAITGLKHELRNLMVETADSIIAYHFNDHGQGRSSSQAQQERDSATFSVPSRTPSAEDIGRYTLADAATFYQITAKEGDAAAQRELATLYLTNPELMDLIIAPLSRPRDVFKDELDSKWRKNQDPNRCDPTTMCVAQHWMTLSSKGGDALAKEFLRQREEMDRLP